MSFNNETCETLMQMPNFIGEHFKTLRTKIEHSKNKNLKEIELLLSFVNSLHKAGLSFENDLFKISQNFQHNMKSLLRDEKICQLYQMLINYLLKYADQIQNTFKGLLSNTKGLQTSEHNFRNVIENVSTSVEANVDALKESMFDYENTYKEYINAYSAHFSPTKKPTESIVTEISDLEQKVLNMHDNLEKYVMFNIDHVSAKLKETASFEAEVKNKIKESTISLMKGLVPEKSDEIDKKIANLDLNLEAYKNNFDTLYKENNLNFSNILQIRSYNLRFCDFSTFHRLDVLYDSPYAKFAFNKLSEAEKRVNSKTKIYVELLCEKLYRHDIEFDKEIIDELHYIISNEKICDYLIYSVIHKKTQILLEKPFASLTLKKSQLKNILQIAQYYFLICANKENVNYENVYHFMKFSLTIFNEQKDCLLEMLNKTLILHDCDFWLQLMMFFTNYLKPKLNIKEDLNSNRNINLMFGIKNMITNITGQPNNLKLGQLAKAFEETSFLIFKCKLDFETITDILMYLAPIAKIPFENVKILLQKNQDLFLAQITQGKIFAVDYRDKIQHSKCVTKTDKIYKVIINILPYIDTPYEHLSLLMINRDIYNKRRKVFDAILYSVTLKNTEFRRFLIEDKINKSDIKDYILKNIPESEIDPIINLDVKRTFCDNSSFDHEGLELILRNVTNPSMGNFAYYQGLNYIVSYFLILFKSDRLLTYNFVVDFVNTHFTTYVDKDLKSLKRLFFYLKRLIRLYLPLLSSYLENEHKLDTDIVFASWCLTLFTTITQYYNNYDLLDQIIDIFIAKSWAGFFQVVLVIMDELQEVLFKLNYEEILILLSELPKNGFYEMIKEHNRIHVKNPKRFNFKEKISKFKNINNSQLAYFSGEYHNILEKVDDFWFKISRKIKDKEGKR